MIAVYILSGILALLLLGWLTQRLAEARDRRRYPPPGKLVDIGGYNLHLQVSGSGSPTVILESGFGDYSLHWKEIQSRLAEVTRVVSYDRAGMGWSDPGPNPRVPSRVADELYKALNTAGIEGPYIIMGHSLGGIFARHFARKHLDEMAGVLLLDSTHEIDELPPELDFAYKNIVKAINIGSILVPIGVSRLLANLSKKKLGEEQRMERIHALRPQTYRAYKGEFNNVQHLPEPFKAGALKDIPLIVLYAEGNITTEAIKDKVPNPEETVRKTRAAIQANNEQLATLSSRSQVVMSPAGHYIQRDDPTLVVEKIKELIEMARSPLA